MSKAIGGFLEIENNLLTSPQEFHPDAIALTSGRSCLNYILSIEAPSLVYIPYYICDTVITLLKNKKINYQFYEIDLNFLPKNFPYLKEREMILYVDYFGLCQKNTQLMSEKYGTQLIVDATQSFFLKPETINLQGYLFNSCRKFFGVPDGAYLYGVTKKKKHISLNNQPLYINHLFLRALGKIEEGYTAYKKNEATLSSEIIEISSFSQYYLKHINCETVRKIRQRNFLFYAQHLSHFNPLKKFNLDDQTPLCYPLLTKQINRDLFHNKKIFIPSFWQECLNRDSSNRFKIEKNISCHLLPLPLDQRYSKKDCLQVMRLIKEKLN